MATWKDNVFTQKVMNLRLWVTPKTIQIDGGQGKRIPECWQYFVKEIGHFTEINQKKLVHYYWYGLTIRRIHCLFYTQLSRKRLLGLMTDPYVAVNRCFQWYDNYTATVNKSWAAIYLPQEG